MEVGRRAVNPSPQLLNSLSALVNSVLPIAAANPKPEVISDLQEIAVERSETVRLAGRRAFAVGSKIEEDAPVLLSVAASVGPPGTRFIIP